MQIFENVNSTFFTHNNIKYVKNFMVIKQGNNSISVHNAYDTRQQLLECTSYSEIAVNGVVYDSQTTLIDALAPLLFVKAGVTTINSGTGTITFGTTAGTSAQGNDYRILNGQTAFGWGNHAGLYSLLNHNHSFASLTGKPTTLAGYGITDGGSGTGGTVTFGTTAGTVTEGNDSRVLNGQTAYGWGNHSGLYSLLAHTHTFASLTAKPTTLAGYGITDGGSGGGAALSGTTDKIVKFTSASAVGDSSLSDNGVLVSSSIDMKINGLRVGRGKGNSENNGAFGFEAFNSNISGAQNIAIGWSTLYSSTTSNSNTAIGVESMYKITSGSHNNCSIGASSLYNMTNGVFNVANGTQVLFGLVTGSRNSAIGFQAGRFIGNKSSAATTVDNAILIGYNASVLNNSSINEIVIGYDGIGMGSNTTVIGNNDTWATAIYGNLLLGTTTSVNSSKLTIQSTTQGVLLPRMTTTQKLAIVSPAEGLEVYDLTLHQKSYFNGTSWINY